MTISKDIYNAVFSKDYSSVWRQFSQENNGTYSKENDHRVGFYFKNFSITFDAHTHYTVVNNSSYEADFTRGIVEFTSPYDFKLLITQQGFLENISKLFGAQDIQTGHKQFDRKFIIKSNDKDKTLLILSNEAIVQSLLENKTIRLELTDGEGLFDEKPKKDNVMLYYILDGKITHIDQLNRMHSLFTNMLDGLIKINSIKSPVDLS